MKRHQLPASHRWRQQAYRDKTLSLDARGLLAFLSSLPAGSAITTKQLKECSEHDNEVIVEAALKELLDARRIELGWHGYRVKGKRP
jgi:hypothetical protein